LSEIQALDEARIFAANRATGAIELEIGFDHGVSRRLRVREEGSVRVRFPGPPAPTLEGVLLNTAGGIAGGDRNEMRIRIGQGAALTMTSASAEKVYRSIGPDAVLDVAFDVGPGASLFWLPRETILFDRSQLRRSIDIDLAEDARLLMAEAVIFGRSDMGEQLSQGRFFDRWRIRRGGRLIYAESTRLDGDIVGKLSATAVARGAVAIASIVLAPGDERLAEAVRAAEGDFRGECGISTWNGISVMRCCAPDGDALRHDILRAMQILLRTPMPRLWLN
jgi:urease accessory protein